MSPAGADLKSTVAHHVPPAIDPSPGLLDKTVPHDHVHCTLRHPAIRHDLAVAAQRDSQIAVVAGWADDRQTQIPGPVRAQGPVLANPAEAVGRSLSAARAESRSGSLQVGDRAVAAVAMRPDESSEVEGWAGRWKSLESCDCSALQGRLEVAEAGSGRTDRESGSLGSQMADCEPTAVADAAGQVVEAEVVGEVVSNPLRTVETQPAVMRNDCTTGSAVERSACPETLTVTGSVTASTTTCSCCGSCAAGSRTLRQRSSVFVSGDRDHRSSFGCDFYLAGRVLMARQAPSFFSSFVRRMPGTSRNILQELSTLQKLRLAPFVAPFRQYLRPGLPH